jgi:predicted deacylase
VRLPELGGDWIKAKVDTGARSSSLHAFDLETFERDGAPWVRFLTHPTHGSNETGGPVEAALLDMRAVKSSSGETEVRPAIRTTLAMADATREIELTLTNRDEMGFRMLLGREALRGSFEVDPGRSFVTGKPPGAGERAPFDIAGMRIGAGKQQQIDLPIARLATGAQVSLPVMILHGRQDGPKVWVNAAIHGDEIGGVEIIRRVLEQLDPETLRGTVIVVPVVNVHGFVNGDRYLPDRRDLNRSFPGGSKGSLARRIAHLLMTEVVARCSVGIDLHTGSDGRTNLPQIRADLNDPTTARLASAFGAPIMIHAKPREASLRGSAPAVGATVLVFEGGEALRFDPAANEVGSRGVLRVFAEMGLIDEVVPPLQTPFRADGSTWVRAGRSGLAQLDCKLGDLVEKGQTLGRIHDSFGRRLSRCKCPVTGLVIGLRLEPMVNRGDALFHVAATVPEESA